MATKIISKRCSQCKENLPATAEYFGKDKHLKDGLHSCCKQCRKQHYKEHKPESRQYHKQYNKTLRGNLRYVWHNMLHRCNNTKHKRYKDYGGRGVKVKFTSFNDFYNHVVNELKTDPHGLTIDRIDNDGHYERGNIRFVSRAENNRNKRIKNKVA